MSLLKQSIFALRHFNVFKLGFNLYVENFNTEQQCIRKKKKKIVIICAIFYCEQLIITYVALESTYNSPNAATMSCIINTETERG